MSYPPAIWTLGRSARVLLLSASALLFASVTDAHTRSQSLSDWSVGPKSQQLRGVFTIDAYRATLLYSANGAAADDLDLVLRRHLTRTVRATQAGTDCSAAQVSSRTAASGFLRAELQINCPHPIAESSTELQIDALFRYAASHVHVLRYTAPDGTALERVLTAERPSLVLGKQATAEELADFIRIGAEHVWLGPDHLAFVLALLLLISGWKALIAAITAFTVGHSLTLIAATAGWLEVNAEAVELLIGFSIAYAALEAARRYGWNARWPRILALAVGLGIFLLLSGLPSLLIVACTLMSLGLAARPLSPALMALGFGLIHGGGFAGAYQSLQPDAALRWPPLLGFNLGVELGQLTVVIAVLVVTSLIKKKLLPDQQRGTAQLACALLLLLGSFWLAERAVSMSS